MRTYGRPLEGPYFESVYRRMVQGSPYAPSVHHMNDGPDLDEIELPKAGAYPIRDIGKDRYRPILTKYLRGRRAKPLVATNITCRQYVCPVCRRARPTLHGYHLHWGQTMGAAHHGDPPNPIIVEPE